jgi:C4-dicarboxylate-specific signal transduction histidine kinase
MSMEGKEREQRQADLQFFGRIMANVSHEVNNVITILGELAGLLADLGELAQRGRPLPVDKLQQITAKMDVNTRRGKEMISHMNRFSHSTDEGLQVVDLAETVDSLAVLTRRLLERRGATLACTAPTRPVPLTCDPFLVQRALFCSWELALAAAGTSPTLEVVTVPDANGGNIKVSCGSGGEEIESREEFQELSQILVPLGGRVMTERINGGFAVHMTLPNDA